MASCSTGWRRLAKSRLLRVQVKSTFLPPHGQGRFGFQVVVSWGSAQRGTRYTLDEIDVLAPFIAQLDIWYLIPVEKLGHRRGKRAKSPAL